MKDYKNTHYKEAITITEAAARLLASLGMLCILMLIVFLPSLISAFSYPAAA